MDKSYSWLEIANMPLCCMCCGSRHVDELENKCLSCGSAEGLWADERFEPPIIISNKREYSQ